MRPRASRAILLAVLKRWIVPSARGLVLCNSTVAVNGALGTGVTKTLVITWLTSWASTGTTRRAARQRLKRTFMALFCSMRGVPPCDVHYSKPFFAAEERGLARI